MKTPIELVQDCRRSWWWSPLPFWRYIDSHGQGWGTLVDTHPGMFNLAWMLSGVSRAPESWQTHTETTQWVVLASPKVWISRQPMLDLAFRLNMQDFRRTANNTLQANLKAHNIRAVKRA